MQSLSDYVPLEYFSGSPRQHTAKYFLIFIPRHAILNLICMYHCSISRYSVRRKQLSILFLIFAVFFVCSSCKILQTHCNAKLMQIQQRSNLLKTLNEALGSIRREVRVAAQNLVCGLLIGWSIGQQTRRSERGCPKSSPRVANWVKYWAANTAKWAWLPKI